MKMSSSSVVGGCGVAVTARCDRSWSSSPLRLRRASSVSSVAVGRSLTSMSLKLKMCMSLRMISEGVMGDAEGEADTGEEEATTAACCCFICCSAVVRCVVGGGTLWLPRCVVVVAASSLPSNRLTLPGGCSCKEKE